MIEFSGSRLLQPSGQRRRTFSRQSNRRSMRGRIRALRADRAAARTPPHRRRRARTIRRRREILAERLAWSALGALGNRVGELDLIFARHLVHVASLPARSLSRILRLPAHSASVRNWTLPCGASRANTVALGRSGG